MNRIAKKIIAPIIITVILITYFILIIFTSVFESMPAAMRIISVVGSLALIGVSIYVLVERIREIRSGEEDDLGKY